MNHDENADQCRCWDCFTGKGMEHKGSKPRWRLIYNGCTLGALLRGVLMHWFHSWKPVFRFKWESAKLFYYEPVGASAANAG